MVCTNTRHLEICPAHLLVFVGRRSIFHNAPAFVPSTLAIDAPLMYPKRDSETASTSQAVKGAGNETAVTDMDVSLPPTPVSAPGC